MSKIAKIIVASIACCTSLLFAQDGSGPLGTVTASSAKVSPVPAQPIYGALAPIVGSQQQIIQDVYCISTSNELWVFELDSSPDQGESISGTNSAAGIGTWTPRVAGAPFNWTEAFLAGEITQAELLDLWATESQVWMLIGDFQGTCGGDTIVALGMSRKIDGQTKYYLIPSVALPETIVDDLGFLSDFGVLERVDTAGCETCDSGCCWERYREDIAQAILDFKDRLRADFPISWKNIACFVGCTPALVGTPLLYAACAAACNGAVSAADAIRLQGNTQRYEDDRAAAKIQYCACLSYQENNCPPAENDQVGCP